MKSKVALFEHNADYVYKCTLFLAAFTLCIFLDLNIYQEDY